MNRKEIAQALDKAASRAALIDARPASSKQVWYLAGLMEKAGETPNDIGLGWAHTGAVLTSAKASHFIEIYR